MHSNWLEALRLHKPHPKKNPHRHQNRGRQALNIVQVHVERVVNFMKYKNQVKIGQIAQHEGTTRVTRTNKGSATWSNIRHLSIYTINTMNILCIWVLRDGGGWDAIASGNCSRLAPRAAALSAACRRGFYAVFGFSKEPRTRPQPALGHVYCVGRARAQENAGVKSRIVYRYYFNGRGSIGMADSTSARCKHAPPAARHDPAAPL